MPATTPRIAPQIYNLALSAGTVITASTAQLALPVAFLRDPIPSKRWRSLLGWNIVAGFNDKIDFNRGGVKVATLAAGSYTTGAALAVAIVAALEAADAPPVWACAYDPATKKFTISSDLAFTLLFGSGTNIATGIGKDLGFAVADTGSATSQVAGSAAYHSREYLLFDLGSAQAVTVGIAHGHNMAAAGAVTLYGKSSANPWLTPGTTQVLAGDDLSSKRILFFGSQSFRYWALVFDDVQNTAGFSELGVPFIGTYWQPGRGHDYGEGRQAAALSTIVSAIDGTLFIVQRLAPKRHQIHFRALSRADRNTYQTIEDAKGHVFLAKDPAGFPGSETVYGLITGTADVKSETAPGPLYGIDVELMENPG